MAMQFAHTGLQNNIGHTIGIVLLHPLVVHEATSSESELADSFSISRTFVSSAPGIVAQVDGTFACAALYVSSSLRTCCAVAGGHSSACTASPTVCTFHYRNHPDNAGIRTGRRRCRTHVTGAASFNSPVHFLCSQIFQLLHWIASMPHMLSHTWQGTDYIVFLPSPDFRACADLSTSVVWCSDRLAHHVSSGRHDNYAAYTVFSQACSVWPLDIPDATVTVTIGRFKNLFQYSTQRRVWNSWIKTACLEH